MKCPVCSAEIPDNARFCPECGTLAEEPETGKDGYADSLALRIRTTWLVVFGVFLLVIAVTMMIVFFLQNGTEVLVNATVPPTTYAVTGLGEESATVPSTVEKSTSKAETEPPSATATETTNSKPAATTRPEGREEKSATEQTAVPAPTTVPNIRDYFQDMPPDLVTDENGELVTDYHLVFSMPYSNDMGDLDGYVTSP